MDARPVRRSATARWRRTWTGISPWRRLARGRSSRRGGSRGGRTRGSARTRASLGCGTTTRNASGRQWPPWDHERVPRTSPAYPFLKGHGTENDFVLLPDHDGSTHGELDAVRVRRLCDRRGGIGADGVLRVLRDGDQWFMDYRNSDGSPSEMCGNGIRVFVRHLVEDGLVDPRGPL